MKQKIRDRIIRRLGGVPIWRVGRDPIPGWFLQPQESTFEQRTDGIWVTVRYAAFRPEKSRRARV